MKISAIIFRVTLATLLILSGISGSMAEKDDTARKLVHRFFRMVYERKYPQAYDCFSKSIKREVSLSRFTQGAGDIRYLKLLEIKVTDREENLIKMNIQARIKMVYKGELFEAVYEGKFDVYREDGKWRVLTVDLKAKSQKALGTKPTPEKLQKLDFGTT